MKCQCGKELTDTDVCPLPSGRICLKQICPPHSWERIEEEMTAEELAGYVEWAQKGKP
jgi:hypothetical protein